MTDYQNGASTIAAVKREMQVAKHAAIDCGASYSDREIFNQCLEIVERHTSLPADPASSEGADAISDKTVQDAVIAMVRRGFEREGRRTFDPSWRPDEDDLDSMRAALTAVWPVARDAEITIARGSLMLLEECCRYSLGLAEDLIGDALTKAVGDKVLAMRDEAAALRAALEKIADTSNWSTDQKVQIAVDALATLKASRQ